MPEMISKTVHEYAGRQLQPGERFNVEPEHVQLLVLLGRAEEPEQCRDMAAGPPAPYRTREMAARRRKS